MSEQVAEQGMWLASPLGWSFACRCGWRSGICPEKALAVERLSDHLDEEHTDEQVG